MNEQQYRLAKTILIAIALIILGAYVWGTRYVVDSDGYITDKWTHKIYVLEDGN